MKDILVAVLVIGAVWVIGSLLITSGNTAVLDLYNWVGGLFQAIG